MAKLTCKVFSIVVFLVLSILIAAPSTFAAQYRYFEYFEGLPSDYIEPGWQGYNYHASDPINSGTSVTIYGYPKTIAGQLYTCVGWKDATDSITPPSGDMNRVTFSISEDSSITWVYKKAHEVTFKVSPMDQRLWSWGANDEGQVGDGSLQDRDTPGQTDAEPHWITVAAGGNSYNDTFSGQTLAIRSDGTLWAWGNNGWGQLGLGDNDTRTEPWRLDADLNSDGVPDADWESVALGSWHTVALKEDGTLWAWGYNGNGQLGIGSTGGNYDSPQRVGAATDWVAVAAGGRQTAAIKSDGTLWTWGYNGNGQLGIGSTGGNYDSPQHVNEPAGSHGHWIAVALGTFHTVALKQDGTLWAWGHNGQGQLGLGDTTDRNTPTPVIEPGPWISVAAGQRQTLAIKSDGTLWAWGGNQYGQLGIGNSDGNAHHTPVQVGTYTDWISVAAGGYHSAALRSDGTLWAWGYNGNGQMGLGDTQNRNTPTQVQAGTAWGSVAAGSYHIVAIDQQNSLWAWGYNAWGQLGLGDSNNRSIPTPLWSNPTPLWANTNVVSTAAGESHTLALEADGSLWAWGGNEYGQLGLGDTNHRPTPIKVFAWLRNSATGHVYATTPPMTWQDAENYAVSKGAHLVTINDSAENAWLVSHFPEESQSLWIGFYQDTSDPNYSEPGGAWKWASGEPVTYTHWAGDEPNDGGSNHATMWGAHSGYWNDDVGTVKYYSGIMERMDPPGWSWLAIAAGCVHTMAIRSDGTLWAWGRNDGGQLGLGDHSDRHSPTQVGGDDKWVSISAGGGQSFAIKTDGTLWAWGWNASGQLGLGDNSNKVSPTQVQQGTTWLSVAAGYQHTLGIKSDGTLWAWGTNEYGQLGLGDTTSRNTPTHVVVGPPASWKAVAAGWKHSAAIRSDGILWAWGHNDWGQLGRGDQDPKYTPFQVGTATDTDWVTVAAGERHTLAIKTDGTLWTWGRNDGGQLGRGSSDDSVHPSPEQVGSGTDWISVAAGAAPEARHSLAIRGLNRLELEPHMGPRFLPEGTEVVASAKLIPTDGLGTPYNLTNFTSVPTLNGSSFTVESEVDFTWTFEEARSVTVSFAPAGLPESVKNASGAFPVEGENRFAEGSNLTLHVDPVVTDPGTQKVYVCTGWTGAGQVPASGEGTSVAIPSLDQDSSITWNYAEARSLTTEFDGLPEHLQGDDRFDPRGQDKGWNPQQPVWLIKDTTQTLTPPNEIYDQGNRVRYVLELGNSFGDGDLPGAGELDGADQDTDPDPFVVTQDSTVTWKYHKELRLRINVGLDRSEVGNPDDATVIDQVHPTADDGVTTSEAGNQLPWDTYYDEQQIVTLTAQYRLVINDQTLICRDLRAVSGDEPVQPQKAGEVMQTGVQLTQPMELVWDYEIAQRCVIGQAITPPGEADITDAPTEVVDDTQTAAATFWDGTNQKLYPVRPFESAIVTWKNQTAGGADIEQPVYAVWPGSGLQKHIVGAPARLEPVGGDYTFEELHYSEGHEDPETGLFVDPRISEKDEPEFNPPAPGRSLLRFSRKSDGALLFVVVNSIEWDDELVDNPTVDVGKDIRSPKDGNGLDIHQDPEGKNGYVLFEKAYYDGLGDDRAYDRSTREGQIIPVNETTADTPTENSMVVVWYETGAAGVGWPVKPVQYLCQWPADAETIIIASGNGSEPLLEYEYMGKIYFQPDPEQAGYNPNEEHALLLGNKVFALRDDLNTLNGVETSKPYVLLKYWYADTGSWTMKVFKVEATGTDAHGNHDFTYPIDAGKPILPLMPMDALPKPEDSYMVAGVDWYHQDHKGGHWAKAANWREGDDPEPAEADKSRIVMRWYYPLQSGFYYPFTKGDGSPVGVGDPVPFLNGGNRHQDPPRDVAYVVSWPDDVKRLTIGETLTEAKYGLPDIVNWAAGEVIFDENVYNGGGPLAMLFDPYTERSVPLSTLPEDLSTESVEGKLRFPDLLYSLRSRLFYDPLNEKIIFKGISYDPGIGEPLVLPNIMTKREKDRLIAFEPYWSGAVQDLFMETRSYIAGPQKLVGVPMALTAGAAAGQGYLVLAENDDESLEAAPVALHVIEVAGGPYRGEIKVIKPDNVFDEKLTLRHSGDFGGEPEKLTFAWYYKPDNSGLPPQLPGGKTDTSGWVLFDEGPGMIDITVEGAGKLTLSDNWFMVHYYYGDQPDTSAVDVAYPALATDPDPYLTQYWSDWAGAPGGETAQLAPGWIKRVVADLNPLDARVKDFRNYAVSTDVSVVTQVGERYEGDIALSGTPENLNNLGLIEAYETVSKRAKDFSIDAAPPTDYGPVNNAILNAGTRIADFYTLLGNEAYRDAQDPTIGFDTRSGALGTMASSIFAFQNQLSSLLEEELALLRGRDDTMSTTRARPVYNRLVWNFTQGDGELAYVQTYNIRDMDASGVVDELDAKEMYPQGHGDAWGHYLTAMKVWYGLLRHQYFTWEPRVESVLVGGAPIPVDYLDERKFAQTAAAKARAGSEIVNLTYRRSYVEDPAGQWQGYKDTDAQRAWGVDGWARRAAQGAYFDWAVANAMLPEKDPVSTHTGIQKIDRSTVPELASIATEFQAIQIQADRADRGLNPLGLAKGVVPFDIDPYQLTPYPGAEVKTHFEQVYGRAVGALENARTVFDYATQYTLMLRQNEDTLVTFKREIEDQERDYTNRLIEIFGYPYGGDIGPGGTFKSGYIGPDLFHFMVVDLPDLTGEVSMGDQVAYTYTFDFNNPSFDPQADPLLKDLNVTTQTDPNGQISATGVQITYHIDSENPWLSRPEGWGKRRAPGEIQMALSDLIKAHASYKQGLTELEGQLGVIQAAVDILKAKYGISKSQIKVMNDKNETISDTEEWLYRLRRSNLAFNRLEETLYRLAEDFRQSPSQEASILFIKEVEGETIDRVATGLVLATIASSVVTDVLEAEEFRGGQEIAEHERDRDARLFIDDARFEVQQMVKELETMESDVRAKLQELYGLREVIHQCFGRCQAALAEGERLLTEREVFRKRAAADVQDYRYQDMGFRTFRNDAVEKYRTTFELAARYAYLAATAYDYETNLLGSETGSGRAFLTDIVKQRSPGVIMDGKPVVGKRGLADPLARLSQNFQVYKGQLGFNNPQIETNRFALRRELFRFKDDPGSDSIWRAELENYWRPNLWNFPPFRRFCRPFADESIGPQPGLVIPFSTEVNFGYNFFGWPLGANDSAYDPSNFTTKIRSVGVWFKGYENAGLSSTPRVYLVPVGADVLRTPDGDDFTTREWHVVDQKLPMPFPVSDSELSEETWIPVDDSLSDILGGIRRFSSFRAFPDSNLSGLSETEIIGSQSTTDTRLIGRSVWNTQWLLIIPGGTLLADPDAGLDAFVNNVKDIKLFFQTYAYSGN